MELEGPAGSRQGRVTACLAGCLLDTGECHRLSMGARDCHLIHAIGTCDSANVDMALTWNATQETRRFASGSRYLIYFMDLVAGTGFEPVTFRL
jgi:hypothetical protein